MHYNARCKVLDANFKVQNTLLNLMNKTLRIFALVTLFKNDETESSHPVFDSLIFQMARLCQPNPQYLIQLLMS